MFHISNENENARDPQSPLAGSSVAPERAHFVSQAVYIRNGWSFGVSLNLTWTPELSRRLVSLVLPEKLLESIVVQFCFSYFA